MRVAFDYQCFQDQPEGGISRYVCNLAEAMRAVPQVEVAGWAGWHQGRPPGFFGGRRVAGRSLSGRGSGRILRLANWLGFSAWLRARRADVYHATYYRSLSAPRRAALVVTAHDCIHERFSDVVGIEPAMKRRIFARADHVICVSECTRKDVMKFYGVSPERLSVVYHGSAEAVEEVSPSGAFENAGRPYALFVGMRGSYKNFETVRAAWDGPGGLGGVCDLVCVGGERIAPGGGVRHFPWASAAELGALYAGALALVYPSKYEGFGLPVLEAMRAGCPVLTTRGGAIPEVAGEAARYCAAEDPREWREAIRHLLRDEAERAELIEKGRRQAAKFTWDACVGGTLAAYEKAMAARDRRSKA